MINIAQLTRANNTIEFVTFVSKLKLQRSQVTEHIGRFAPGSRHSPRSNLTPPLSATPAPASLMRTRMKLLSCIAPCAPASCGAFRFTEILDRLRGFAASGSKAGRRQFFELLERDLRRFFSNEGQPPCAPPCPAATRNLSLNSRDEYRSLISRLRNAPFCTANSSNHWVRRYDRVSGNACCDRCV